MILDELVLHDFGVYRGRQVFPLTPISDDRPIILIGAQNGAGKTTFLEGLQLAFFGRAGQGQFRGGVAYEEYLRRSINRGAAAADGAAVQVKFRRRVEGRDRVFDVRRSWTAQAQVREHFEVLVDGVLDRVLTAQWSEYVEELLPPRIAPLFFFDGEKIEQFANIERSAELIGTAVSALLGLDIVDRLSLDLDVFERRKAAAHGDTAGQQELKAAADATSAAEAAARVAKTELAGAVSRRDRRVAQLEKARRQLKAEGGDLFAARNELRAIDQQVDVSLTAAKRALRGWAGEVAPLMLVRKLLAEIAEQADREGEGDAARAVVGVLIKRDAQMLKLLRGAGAGGVALREAQKFMDSDRHRLTALAATDRYLDLPAAARGALAGLRDEGFPACEEVRDTLLVDLARLQTEKDDVERQIAAIPAPEDIAPLLASIRAEEEALQLAEVEAGVAQKTLDAAQRDLAAARSRYQEKLDRQVQTKLLAEDAQRMLEHSARVRQTLLRFKIDVIKHHVHRIEALVVDGLRKLLRKDDLVVDVKIDPADFSIELRGGAWDTLPPEQLSAGERQLFAVALLWALARASGQTAPTIIDTPLGRLDSAHRARLVDGYFPEASHQVILLSTDEEIDQRQYDRLRPLLSRGLTVEYDPEIRGSRVREGYDFATDKIAERV